MLIKPRVEIYNVDEKQYIVCDNKVYEIDKYTDLSPINTLSRHNGNLVVTRNRDYGGCGRNAFKPEKNVPLSMWLIEVHAKPALCAFCDDNAVAFEIAPVCKSCHSTL